MKLKKSLFLGLIAFVTLLTSGLFQTDASAKVKSVKNTDATYSQMYSVAKSKLGKPYSWGAVGPNSFDCSGFTSYVYKKGANVSISRTAQAQYNTSKHVSYKNIQKGDLVFFGSSSASISHVGMYIGNGKMIDAQNSGVITEAVKAPWWNYVGAAHVANFAD
ncbi:C40 family peptidase [Lentilactobacillus sp. Marseille-Q4993]|uniref:C40 family peptidase n=1 Tax=Lentilactobacillus sp. Marseille-Q4993 TaxID=3039492 RepID=UPI0024BD41A2|nr:C40 family peptidase [Lentilactobacillus sp. Marseille-Q4993]